MKKIRILLLILLTLPLVSCESLIVKPADQDLHMEDFEATWQRIRDVYPFLEFKQID